MPQVEGPFQVKLSPQPLHAAAEGMFGRMALDKRFEGALQADSRGEMLAATTAVPGSAGYVALEKVDGTLDGRRGSFLLLHSGLMNRGQAELTIVVVPDSGSGELQGLSGTLAIHIDAKGAHSYTFDYSLPSE